MVSSDTFRRGLHKGLSTTWELGKVTVPLYIIITLLKYSGILPHIARWLSPIMSIFGLPGEAAVPLVTGYVLHLYAAAGAILSLDLNAREVTILSLMLCFCHSLLVEGAITRKTRIGALPLTVARLASSLAFGIGLNLVL